MIDSVKLHISEVEAFSVVCFQRSSLRRVQIGGELTLRGCKLTLQIECQGKLTEIGQKIEQIRCARQLTPLVTSPYRSAAMLFKAISLSLTPLPVARAKSAIA